MSCVNYFFLLIYAVLDLIILSYTDRYGMMSRRTVNDVPLDNWTGKKIYSPLQGLAIFLVNVNKTTILAGTAVAVSANIQPSNFAKQYISKWETRRISLTEHVKLEKASHSLETFKYAISTLVGISGTSNFAKPIISTTGPMPILQSGNEVFLMRRNVSGVYSIETILTLKLKYRYVNEAASINFPNHDLSTKYVRFSADWVLLATPKEKTPETIRTYRSLVMVASLGELIRRASHTETNSDNFFTRNIRKRSDPCKYAIPIEIPEIYVLSNSGIDSEVAELSVISLRNKRRRRYTEGTSCPDAETLDLTTESSYFYLYHSGTSNANAAEIWFVKVKSCLQAGATEYLNLTLKDSSNKTYAQHQILMTIEPTPPTFIPSSHVGNFTADTGCDLKHGIKIASVNNAGSCISFNCSVQWMENSTLFWVANGTDIMTAAGTIQIGQIYELTITCIELTSDSHVTTHTTIQVLEVVFSNKCANSLSLLSSVLNVSQTSKHPTSRISNSAKLQPPLSARTLPLATLDTLTSAGIQTSTSIIIQTLLSAPTQTQILVINQSVASVTTQTLVTKQALPSLTRQTLTSAAIQKSAISATQTPISVTTRVLVSVSFTTPTSVTMHTHISAKTRLQKSATSLTRTSPTKQASSLPVLRTLKSTSGQVATSELQTSITPPGLSDSPTPALYKCNMESSSDGFLNDPGYVAAVATVGGVIVGIALAVGCFILSYKLKICPPVGTAISNKEEQSEEDLQNEQI